MVIIAFIVIATNQSSLTEMRMSSNDADRKIAMSRAENGLRAAETRIQDIVNKNTTTIFDDSCTKGYCQPAKGSFNKTKAKAPFQFNATNNSTIQAWNRCKSNNNTDCNGKLGQTVLDDATKTIRLSDDTRYIIEYLGQTNNKDGEEEEIFRITSRAKGNNENTSVTLQSYVGLLRD